MDDGSSAKGDLYGLEVTRGSFRLLPPEKDHHNNNIQMKMNHKINYKKKCDLIQHQNWMSKISKADKSFIYNIIVFIDMLKNIKIFAGSRHHRLKPV